MLLATAPARRLGVPADRARLRIGRADPEQPFSARQLSVSGRPAFELSLWCGTCPFLFERQEGASETLSADAEPVVALEGPLSIVDDAIIDRFGSLLEQGDYLPLLLEVGPELVAPHDARDYFTHEQVATWGVDAFWGLPENPRSFYYRTFETRVDDSAHLYEFVVPMVPPAWNERGRVEHYQDLLSRGGVPTAVALSTLDLCQPAMAHRSTDYYQHWGLTHFLLDGHHKVEAAARAGRAVRLLALVSLDQSRAAPPDLVRLVEVRGRAGAGRPVGA